MNPIDASQEAIPSESEVEAWTAALEARAEARRIAVAASFEARRIILDRIAEAA